jgi:hypothetical protein
MEIRVFFDITDKAAIDAHFHPAIASAVGNFDAKEGGHGPRCAMGIGEGGKVGVGPGIAIQDQDRIAVEPGSRQAKSTSRAQRFIFNYHFYGKRGRGGG